MENRIVSGSLKRQLNHVVLHEQMENGIAISNNLSVDQLNQRFETPIRIFQTEKKHPWIEEIHVGHRMPCVTSIILHEVQTSETQRRTSNLLQNSRKEECQIENVIHKLNLEKGVGNLNFDKELCWN